MTVESKSFDVMGKQHGSAFVVHAGDSAFVNGTNGEDGFINVPRILFQLLVTQAQATILGVHFKNNHFDGFTHFGELGGMFDFLVPGEVGDVNQAVNALFQFHENTEGREVTDRSGVAGTDRIFLQNVSPRIGDELLDTQGHLLSFAVKGEHHSFHFVTDFEEVVSGAQVL